MQNKHIMIIAGEASGDLHGARLVEALKQIDPRLTFSGLGGMQMQKSGVTIYEDLTQKAVVGFLEVVKHYSYFKKIFDLILTKIKEIKPAAVVLIDYPGFNMHLAKKLQGTGIKVIYYISPQVWAWKKNRVHAIKKHVHKMLVIFKFEKDFYTKYGIDTEFVGHPLLDSIHVSLNKETFCQKYGLDDYKSIVTLLPGSRIKEIERHLPVMIESALKLKAKFPMMQFLLIKAPTITHNQLQNILQQFSLSIKVISDHPYEAINASNACIVASGTATLEVAVLGKPMVIIYKTSWPTWFLAKWFVKIPYVGLVNVVAGKKIVPECLQHNATALNIARHIEEMLCDEIKLADIKFKLKEVRNSLGENGASRQAALAITKVIS